MNLEEKEAKPSDSSLLNMEGCMAPGGPCNTETGDTNCCYAFGTYKCMGELGK